MQRHRRQANAKAHLRSSTSNPDQTTTATDAPQADEPADTTQSPDEGEGPTKDHAPGDQPRVETEPPEVLAHLRIEESASLALVRKKGLTFFVEEGGIQGTLTGTMRLRARLAGSKGVKGRFVVTLQDKTTLLWGTAEGRIEPHGSYVGFDGTADITGGTGRYKHARARELAWRGRVAPDASTASLTLSGELTY